MHVGKRCDIAIDIIQSKEKSWGGLSVLQLQIVIQTAVYVAI